MTTVPHYGLHMMEGDIALLVQQNRVDNVTGVHIDLNVSVNLRQPCSHLIDLTGARCDDELLTFLGEELFRAMLPLPRESHDKTLFLEDTHEHRLLVNRLADLTSPGSFAVLRPFWMAQPRWLNETNIQPLALHGVELHKTLQFGRWLMAAEFSPRRLIMLGPSLMTVGERAKRITTSMSADHFDGLDLEAFGAWALQQRMMGRPIDGQGKRTEGIGSSP